ncbi:MAG: CoA-transferase subunit beta [Thermoplasmata archaeon]
MAGGLKKMSYTSVEMMTVAAARVLEDKKTVFVGTGLPLLSAMLAKRLHAPNLTLIFESGSIGSLVPRVPLSVGDSLSFYRALLLSGMDYVMSVAQGGFVDYGFIGGAQIDSYGNLNTTVIGSWYKPMVRLPGSGGNNDVASFCWKTIIIMKQDKSKFVKKLDFMTSPGYIDSKGREPKGLPKDTGPFRLITQLGVYDFNPITKKIRLIETYPGVNLQDIQNNSSFEIEVSETVKVSDAPSGNELKIMRELDPLGVVISFKK